MLKRVTVFGTSYMRVSTICRNIRGDFVIFPAHDELPCNQVGTSPAPRGREIQFLQLLIKSERPPVKVRVVFSLWPQIRELRLLLQNVIDESTVDQPFVIQRRGAFHAIVDFAGRFSQQRESPSLDLEHVLEPGLHPTAD
jgi:hypothetical protein